MVKALTLAATVFSLLAVLSMPRTATAQETALLLPVRGEGVDASALSNATTSIRRRLGAQGVTVRLVEENIPGVDVSLADLGQLAADARAAYIVDPALQDFAGMTSLRIRVVSAEGRLLGEAADLANASTLPQQASQILANAMQSVPRDIGPGTSRVESPFNLGAEPAATQGPPIETPRSVQPQPRPRRRRARPRRPRWPDRLFWMGVLAEPAMGTNRSAFNLLTGVRAELQWRGLTFAINIDYSFVKDYEPRSDPDYHTMSISGMVGYKIRLGGDRISLPLLIGGGYIPGNGGLLRIEGGLSIRAIDRMEIRIMFLCPNFWFMSEDMVLFTGLSVGLLWGF